jgi:YesK-like protein
MMVLGFMGLFWGTLLFVFTYTVSKKFGAYFIPPLVNFFAAFLITAYGLVLVGRFEGMAYGFMGVGILISAIIGTISMKFLGAKGEQKRLVRRDKITLIVIPVIFVSSLMIIINSQENYWIIEEGSKKYVEAEGNEYENSYRVTTISEGKKQVTLMLGKDYLGKELDVKKVRQRGRTEIILDIAEGENGDHTPYIMIGVNEINEPLTVRTIDGVVFESIGEKVLGE